MRKPEPGPFDIRSPLAAHVESEGRACFGTLDESGSIGFLGAASTTITVTSDDPRRGLFNRVRGRKILRNLLGSGQGQ